MRFIKEKHPGCKKITLSAPIIRTDNYNANKENERFISILNKSDVSYIAHDNIIKKHLYRDGLHLNRIGLRFLLRIFCLLSGEIDFFIIRLEIKAQQMK